MGEARKNSLRVDFNNNLKLGFHRAGVMMVARRGCPQEVKWEMPQRTTF